MANNAVRRINLFEMPTTNLKHSSGKRAVVNTVKGIEPDTDSLACDAVVFVAFVNKIKSSSSSKNLDSAADKGLLSRSHDRNRWTSDGAAWDVDLCTFCPNIRAWSVCRLSAYPSVHDNGASGTGSKN